MFLLGIVVSDNSTFDGSVQVVNGASSFETDQANQPCDKPSDIRAEQCSAFDNVPYSDQLLKWYPYYDPSRPCALICRGEQQSNRNNNIIAGRQDNDKLANQPLSDKPLTSSAEEDESDESIVVQLADKVQDGTKCYPDSKDICINGECMRVGCDMRVGSNKNRDACGVCGGDGSTCNVKYAWTLESTSACSESCGGGFKIATSVCKSTGSDENIVDNSKCDAELKLDKVLLPCNTHPCSTKWLTGEWSKCSVSCGGGSRTRAVFCIEENGNATSKLPDYKCSANHKPKYQEICNTFSCPMWESGDWSECSASCGPGVKTRNVECRDGNDRLSDDCDPSQRPRSEQECWGMAASIDCSTYGDEIAQPLMQSYPPAPLPEKLLNQPVPSQSTFIADEWSPCSVTCGEGIRHREVHCKIFLEFSRTIVKLPDLQCSGSKPVETEKCTMPPCGLIENSLSYQIDTVGDSSYAESSLTDSFKSSASAVAGGGGASSGSSSGSSYESNVKVASGSSIKTSYSWKEIGYTDCSATCLGGVQDLIINCVRDDTGKTVMPLLCTEETKPESRIRVCNDHPCPPRWNTSEFSPCMRPCGLGIQTREVTCIHEVTRGTGNTVAVPNHMCPQPPPVDRQYCNVWDCPVDWKVGEWGKCSKTCGGGVKKRKVSCEQVMAQGHKQSRPERDCPTSKPRTEKECGSRSCDQLSAGAQPIITSKNMTYIQDDPGKKVNLDIGGQATIFQGTPVIKIRCPVKKFDKAHIVWRKDHEELRKSRKHKINKKGALKIVDISFSDSGIYSCWAGQTNAVMHLTVKPKPRDLMSNEEVLRSGNAVHQRQGAHLSSAPVNSEPFYSIYGENTQESRQESQKSSRTTENPRRKKQKQASPSPSESTGKYDYSVTPMHQPVESTAASSASMLMPHLSHIITTIKSYWPFQDSTYSDYAHNIGSAYYSRNDAASMTTSTTTGHRSSITDVFSEPSRFDPTRAEFDFFHSNTAIPDNTFGPDEERIFIDDDPFETEETIFDNEHKDVSRPNEITPTRQHHQTVPTVTMVNFESHSMHAHHHHGSTEAHFGRNQRGTHKEVTQFTPKVESEKEMEDQTLLNMNPQNEVKRNNYVKEVSEEKKEANSTSSLSEETLLKITDEEISQDLDKDTYDTPSVTFPSSSPSPIFVSSAEEDEVLEKQVNETLSSAIMDNATVAQVSRGEDEAEKGQESKVLRNTSKEDVMEIDSTVTASARINSMTPVVLGREDKNHEPTIGSVAVFSKAKDDLIFEWVTTDWSRCSQTCGGGGFQMRGAQCTVRSAKNESNATKAIQRTVIGASLCEDAGYPVPEKVRPCGAGRCPEWYAGEWSPCETSRCFNWKTAMQRREISCRLMEETEDKIENSTITDPSKCDEAMRPPQRQECYNDACKGVWRVGEWSSCSASCEEDGIKYRILQCVWYGTKKPAGNACRDIPRPPVMKTCRGPPCPKSPDDCKDHSQLCGRVKLMNMCRVPLYEKQCCKSCH